MCRKQLVQLYCPGYCKRSVDTDPRHLECDKHKRTGHCQGVDESTIVKPGVLCSDCTRKEKKRILEDAMKSDAALRSIDNKRKHQPDHERLIPRERRIEGASEPPRRRSVSTSTTGRDRHPKPRPTIKEPRPGQHFSPVAQARRSDKIVLGEDIKSYRSARPH